MTGLNTFESDWIATEDVYLVVLIAAAAFFLCMIIDLFCLQKIQMEHQGIDKMTYLDPVTGGLNRYSCDLLLENYDTDAIRPALACFIFKLTNLAEINEKYGREQGNMVIKNFYDVLSKQTGERGIVARNSPNHYLVMLKQADEQGAETYIRELSEMIEDNNADAGLLPMKYNYGMALNYIEKKPTISELIALAQQRID